MRPPHRSERDRESSEIYYSNSLRTKPHLRGGHRCRWQDRGPLAFRGSYFCFWVRLSLYSPRRRFKDNPIPGGYLRQATIKLDGTSHQLTVLRSAELILELFLDCSPSCFRNNGKSTRNECVNSSLQDPTTQPWENHDMQNAEGVTR